MSPRVGYAFGIKEDFDGRRGYVRVDMDRDEAQVDFRTVSAITTPGGGISTTASFVTEVGSPGLQSA